MTKKLIVFSADAMVTDDLEHFKTLPGYRKYLAGGSEISRVKSVYPTITYPCHATMCTGVWPKTHGISGNLEFLPGTPPPIPWLWDRKWNLCPDDIFFEAKKAGLSTAAVFWPTTGNHPAIDYLIDEYWPQGEGDTDEAAFRRMGSDDRMIEIFKRHNSGKRPRRHPDMDYAVISCTCDILREYQPDVLFLHPANIDSYRHGWGVFNDHVRMGVDETDAWIGQIMETLRDIGLLEKTNFVLTSDHGQMDITRVINLNVLLRERGLIDCDSEGKVVSWRAWCLSGGMSCQVHLKDPQDRKLYGEVYALLQELRDAEVYGISQVFTAEELKDKEQVCGSYSFMVETDGYTSFGDSWRRPLIKTFDTSDYRYGHATHGYLPEKGPWPMMLCKGPDFAENVVIPEGRLVDQAPTFAKLLGIPLPLAEGKAIDEILR